MDGQFKFLTIALALLSLTACSFDGQVPDGPPADPINLTHVKSPTPKALKKSRYGNPPSYVVLGKRYYVLPSAKGYNKKGIASWYGTKFHGHLTSSREIYNMYAMTAASKVLPIPCYVKVTDLQNGRQIVVKVNDRGPFAPNRIIDLSYATAYKLNMLKNGTALVDVHAINFNQSNNIGTIPITHQPELFLQLGSFADKHNAYRLKSQLAKLTRRPVRVENNDKPHHYYRVQVGPLIGVGETDKLKAMFAQHGYGDALTVIA